MSELSSIQERWLMDVEDYKRGAKNLLHVPQCESCAAWIKGNVYHCQVFTEENKPKDVLFAKKECPAFRSTSPLEIAIHSQRESKVYGGVFGFCVGDMLGVPVEFSTPQERAADPVRELRAHGTYNQPFGAWSDDTSLMLCLMDAISEGLTLDRLRDDMIAFYDQGLFTPDGIVFDIGLSTKAAIQRMKQGVAPAQCGGRDTRDNGNGSLMRVLPLAFLYGDMDAEQIIALASDVSSLTHGHPRSIFACIFYTIFAKFLFDGLGKEDAYDQAVAFVKQNCAAGFAGEMRWYEGILEKRVLRLARDQVRSSGYVVDTLEAAVWSFFQADSYRDAVLGAVNLGGDTDTIAALTGGLAGIYYGFEALPQSWIQTVRKKEQIQALTAQMWSRIMEKNG